MAEVTSVYDRIQNAAHRLNAEAYIEQGRARRRMRQFSPCPKALVLLESLHDDRVMLEVEQEVVMTPCSCHNDLTPNRLLDMEFDPSWKEANYAGHVVPKEAD